MVTPPCYNRPPRAAGTWEATGRTKRVPTGKYVLGLRLFSDPKPVYRWRQSAFEDKCVTHDGRGIGPNGESYPQAHGWDCAGCRWEPQHLRQAREFDARMKSAALMIGEPGWGRFFKPYWGDRPETIQTGCATYRPNDWVKTYVNEGALEQHVIPRELVHLDSEPVDKSVHNAEVIHMSGRRAGKTAALAKALEDTRDAVDHLTGLRMSEWRSINNDALGDLRAEVTRRAIEFYQRTGRPVRLTCGDQTVGHIGPTEFPDEVYR